MMDMQEITIKQYNHDRLIAALELLQFLAKRDRGLYLTDINEVLTVAGMDLVKKPCEKEPEVIS